MTYFGLFIATAGLALIVAGQRMFWFRQLARTRGQRIEGRIVKWKDATTNRTRNHATRNHKYTPEVTFVDPEGLERTVKVSYQYTALFMHNNPIGSPITVLFDPMHPDRILDTTWTMAYFLPGLLNCCGLMVMLLGIGIVFGQ